jgi:hypothetical protein
VKYSLISGTDAQKAIVDTVVAEWWPYANVTFQRVDQNGDIRIDFQNFQYSCSGCKYFSCSGISQLISGSGHDQQAAVEHR